MAIFHCQIKPISRGAGRSCTAAAAYRACEKLTDDYTGQHYDFTRKSGLVETAIITPDQTPISRQALWSLAESAEKRRDARTAREYELALPHELPEAAAIACAHRFAAGLVKRYGCAADVAIHAHGAGDKRNLHAHIMTTTRRFENGQLTEKTHAELSDKKLRSLGIAPGAEQVTKLRAAWASIVNEVGREYGMQKISALSLKAQGIDREPQRHLGKHAAAMERKGIHTRIGNENRRARGELLPEARELADLKEDVRMLEEVHASIEAARSDLPTITSTVKEEQRAIQAAELEAQRERQRHHRSHNHGMGMSR